MSKRKEFRGAVAQWRRMPTVILINHRTTGVASWWWRFKRWLRNP